MRNLSTSLLVATAIAAGPPLCTGGCAAPPDEATAEQGITQGDLWTALDITTAGPNNKTIGVVGFGGYANLAADLHTFRVTTLGEADVTALTEMDQTGGTSFPAFNLAGAQDFAGMVQGIAISGAGARIKVAHANSETDANFAAAVDALRTSGVDQIVGVSQFGSAPNLQTALHTAASAGIQILWATGEVASGDGFTTTTPLPAGIKDAGGTPIVLGIGVTALSTAMNARGYVEGIVHQSVSATNLGASATMPGDGPQQQPQSSTSSSAVTLTKSKPYAIGLASGAFYRHLAWKKAADLTAADFFDVKDGSVNGTCSPASLCTTALGTDGPSGVGTPDVAKF